MSTETEYPKCASCGTSFIEHLGVEGTCKALLEALAANETLTLKLAKANEEILRLEHVMTYTPDFDSKFPYGQDPNKP